MSLFKKKFPPKNDAFYIICKNAEHRTAMIGLLESNGFVTDHFMNQGFDTHPNIQVHQSDYMAKHNRKAYFNVWSLKIQEINYQFTKQKDFYEKINFAESRIFVILHRNQQFASF